MLRFIPIISILEKCTKAFSIQHSELALGEYTQEVSTGFELGLTHSIERKIALYPAPTDLYE